VGNICIFLTKRYIPRPPTPSIQSFKESEIMNDINENVKMNNIPHGT
jgi:hypothetical protein